MFLFLVITVLVIMFNTGQADDTKLEPRPTTLDQRFGPLRKQKRGLEYSNF